MNRAAMPIDSTRLPQGEVAALMDKLDADEGAAPAKAKRKGDRLSYRSTARMVLLDPAGRKEEHCFVVHTRNLSELGVGLLHGGFIHPGTVCRMGMTTLDGAEQEITGKIAWCGYVSGRIHQIGVKFDDPVDPSQFISTASMAASLASSSSTMVREPATGRVLFIDDNELERELLAMHLQSTSISLTTASTIEESTSIAKSVVIDLVVADLELGPERGEDAIRALRVVGYRGPVVVLTGSSDKTALSALRTMRVEAIVKKPYDAPQLLALLTELLRRRGPAAGEGPVYSQLGAADKMGEAIGKYIRAVQKKLADLEGAVNASDLASVRTILGALRDTGGGFGFPTLSECAGAAFKSLEATQSLADAAGEIRRLAQLGPRLAVKDE